MSTSEREDAKALLELKEGGPELQSKKQKITHKQIADLFADSREVQRVVMPTFWQGMDAHTTQVILARMSQLQTDGFSYTETLPPPARGDVYTRPMGVYYGKLAVSINAQHRRDRETMEGAAKDEAAKK